VAGSFALWFATPAGGLPVWAVMLAVVVSLVGVEFATAFTNAMLPGLARPGRIGRLSGAGWSVGYLGGIVSLVLVLGWLAPAQADGRTLFGLTPLLPLGGAHAADRLTGPYSALWYALFVIPLFVFVPEEARPAARLGAAVRQGLRRTWATLTHIRRLRNIALFLLARMAYFDGLTALFVFGGIYAAGQFGWATMELGVYGVVITFFAAAGALAAGPIDDRLGPKKVCLAALWVLLVCVVAIGSLERERVLFVVATAPARPDALFSSLPEQAFLALSAMIGIFAGPLQASSRSLMARISPSGQMTAFFGLYALSGKATAFLAPLSVALLTSWSGTQRLGLAAVLVFLGAGLALLSAVREERAPSVLEE